MAGPNTAGNPIDPTLLNSFSTHLSRSKRIIALLGAGLSASSGLPTFRGAGGLWRTHDAISLATPSAFRRDPSLVWQFYSYRRHMALNANPNRAHLALAALSRKLGPEGFMTLSQNVDGLSPRAGHAREGLKLLHGSLYDVKCWDESGCGYVRRDDFSDPIVAALGIPEDQAAAEESVGSGADQGKVRMSESLKEGITRKNALIRGQDIADADVPIPSIRKEDLPQCPQCKRELLRPGVVWFGESLPEDVMEDVHAWIDTPEKIDLMLVIGTSSVVYPAAGYTEIARRKGARVAVINMDQNDAKGLTKWDWFFQGDAAAIVPELLKSVVGEIGEYQEKREALL